MVFRQATFRACIGLLLVAGTFAIVLGPQWLGGDARAQSTSRFDGLQITFAPSGVTFFDELSGDVWIHPFQITGAIGVAHFRVSERGAKLTRVVEKD
jgi:hypothetical protein